MHTFRVSSGDDTSRKDYTEGGLDCVRGCYDPLWDIDGEHQKIEGWPFVSTGEIRRYYANRGADFLDKANNMEESSILMADSIFDISGRRFERGAHINDHMTRNPLCTKGKRMPYPINSIIGHCSLEHFSRRIPHCCDETGKITCKEHVECNFTCSTRKELDDHTERFKNYCTVPGCKRFGYGNGFARKDNLTQHMRKVHKRFIPRVASRFSGGGRMIRTLVDKLPQDPRLGTFELAGAPSETADSEDTSAEAAEHTYSGGESSVAFGFRKVQDDYEHGWQAE
ncbi:hypothetical protein DFP73DRAFT_558269 [Morchella snyderi]|nr:hypothetical protein DFP73DRAFT_558269 [Morchella snyderi]